MNKKESPIEYSIKEFDVITGINNCKINNKLDWEACLMDLIITKNPPSFCSSIATINSSRTFTPHSNILI